jgi:hypothetical protein
MMTLIQMALLLAIGFTYSRKDDGVNYFRLGLMTLFSFCAGINVGSWINIGLSQVENILISIQFSAHSLGWYAFVAGQSACLRCLCYYDHPFWHLHCRGPTGESGRALLCDHNHHGGQHCDVLVRYWLALRFGELHGIELLLMFFFDLLIH